MTFEFREQMIEQYSQQGFMVFRGIIPPALLRDLRHEADKARDLAHRLNGPQTQRIQPLDRYSPDINLQPFRDYAELDILQDAVDRLLGPGYSYAHLDIMGLLVEPVEKPWHCGWHRDGVVEVPEDARDAPVQAFMATIWHDLRFYNQVNCAIYADSCTWFVPGSHLRQQDLPGERQSTGDPLLRNPPEQWSNEEAEQRYFDHCRAMPGAEPVHLGPGDFMIYRNLGWHTGLYLPYQPRATIHDIVRHPDIELFRKAWKQVKEDALTRMRVAKPSG
jgi:hypothetical protein